MRKALLALVAILALAGCGGGGGGGGASGGGGGGGSALALPPTIATAALPDATERRPYAAAILASNPSAAPVEWRVSAGALPPGLSLAPSGAPSTTISGTPSASGTFAFTVEALDTFGGKATTRALSLEVKPRLAIVTTSLALAVEGASYAQALEAAGGANAGYAWRVAAGALPAGLSLGASGTPATAIAGTPTAAGTASVTIEVTDAGGGKDTRTFALDVRPALAISTATLRAGTRNAPYAATITAAGGSGAGYRWGRLAGLLPDGLTIARDATPATALSGTPSRAGTFTFTLDVTDDTGATASRAFTQTINAELTISPGGATLQTSVQGASYQASLTGAGGSGAGYRWSVAAGALPPGLSLPSTGTPSSLLSGSPTAQGTYSFTVRLEDDNGASATRAYSITVNAPLAIAAATLPRGVSGTAYGQALQASGGDPVGGASPGYHWSVVTGTLPPGLALAASGTPATRITGVPSSAGTFSFSVRCQDGRGNGDVLALSIIVDPPSSELAIRTRVLPGAVSGTAYAAAIATSGGTPPFSWRVASGALPAGLSLAAAGASASIAGTPSAPTGAAFFEVEVADSSIPAPVVRRQPLRLAVLPPDASRWAAYQADERRLGTVEVFAVDVSGAAPARFPVLASWPIAASARLGPSYMKLSPDGRRLAFIADLATDEAYELYTVDLSGATPGAPARVSGALAAGRAVEGIAWSPDSTRLLYTADQDADDVVELYLADASGASAPRKVNGPLVAGGDVPLLPEGRWGFSPDGARAAYAADEEVDGQSQVYVVSIAGAANGPAQRVSAPLAPGSQADELLWAAPGVLLYMADETPGKRALFAADVSGGAPAAGVALSKVPASGGGLAGLFRVALSPDATRAAYFGNLDAFSTDECWLVDVPTSSAAPAPVPVKLNPPYVSGFETVVSLAWSPAGDKLAYAASERVQSVEVYVVDAGGARPGASQLASAPLTGSNAIDDAQIDFSPDGRRLAYGTIAPNGFAGNSGLYLVDVSGSIPGAPVRADAPHPGGDGTIIRHAFSPDSTRIVYWADVLEFFRYELFLVDVAAPGTAKRVNAAGNEDVLAEWAWSRDGRRVFYRQAAPAFAETFVADVSGATFTQARLNGALDTNASVKYLAAPR